MVVGKHLAHPSEDPILCFSDGYIEYQDPEGIKGHPKFPI